MKNLITLLCLILLTACNATTRMSGFVDPKYKNDFQTNNILVAGIGMSLEEQRALEDSFATAFSPYNVSILSGLEVFPPTRDFSNKDVVKIAKQSGADTILLVSSDDRAIDESYVPPTYHPGTSTSYVSGYGNYATINTYHSPGYTTGGYTLDKPKMSVSAVLINTKNKDKIWTGDGISSGNAFANFTDLINNTAKTTVNELAKESLIRPLESAVDDPKT